MRVLVLLLCTLTFAAPAFSQAVGDITRSQESYRAWRWVGSDAITESAGWVVYERGNRHIVAATRVVGREPSGGWRTERIRTVQIVTLERGEESIVECNFTLSIFKDGRFRAFNVNNGGSISRHSGRGFIEDCGSGD